ncbi:MAG TPA: cbb3-type cytochrome oxidase assembly protein CcoS [Bacteroidetes bacterium]|nr:cbb3-type cytochrome oxidase assembly protein CcoS [Bacteroidota bacterium]
MSVLWVLVGFSVVVAAGFLVAFIWAVRAGQYDDKYTPSVRILFEEEHKTSTFGEPPKNNPEGTTQNGDGNNTVRQQGRT